MNLDFNPFASTGDTVSGLLSGIFAPKSETTPAQVPPSDTTTTPTVVADAPKGEDAPKTVVSNVSEKPAEQPPVISQLSPVVLNDLTASRVASKVAASQTAVTEKPVIIAEAPKPEAPRVQETASRVTDTALSSLRVQEQSVERKPASVEVPKPMGLRPQGEPGLTQTRPVVSTPVSRDVSILRSDLPRTPLLPVAVPPASTVRPQETVVLPVVLPSKASTDKDAELARKLQKEEEERTRGVGDTTKDDAVIAQLLTDEELARKLQSEETERFRTSQVGGKRSAEVTVAQQESTTGYVPHKHHKHHHHHHKDKKHKH